MDFDLERLIIKRDDLTDAAVLNLVQFHNEMTLQNADKASPSFLTPESLKGPDVHFWTAWQGQELCGMGGFKIFDEGKAELKSFRTIEKFRARGLGGKLLDHIIGEARLMGLRHLFLGTGANPYYDSAVRLYRSRGFVPTEPFDCYEADPYSHFFVLSIVSLA